jgi:hypothetical protein
MAFENSDFLPVHQTYGSNPTGRFAAGGMETELESEGG